MSVTFAILVSPVSLQIGEVPLILLRLVRTMQQNIVFCVGLVSQGNEVRSDITATPLEIVSVRDCKYAYTHTQTYIYTYTRICKSAVRKPPP